MFAVQNIKLMDLEWTFGNARWFKSKGAISNPEAP